MFGAIRLSEQFGKPPRHPLSHPAGVDEYERSAVLLDQSREATIDLLPYLRRHHCFERRIRNLQSEITVAAMSGIHDGAVRSAFVTGPGADQKPRNILDGFLRRREPNAQQAMAAN